MTDHQARATTWHEIILATLKANNVKLIVYVPDRVFTPLIKSLHADQFFTRLLPLARKKPAHRNRCVDGWITRRRPDADQRVRYDSKCARLVVDRVRFRR